jgi:membrane protease subunit (stomatin/prohibitin family)
MVKGQKRISGRSSNTKGNDNIISNGSVIAVADGQAMMIVEQGKVVEFCAEPGEFTYDTSTEPSIFAGSLGDAIKETFKTIGKRFTFGGDTAKDQRVYYFNTKEIMGNKYGTATPIPFKVVVNEEMGLKLSVDIRCNGEYTYKLTNPLLFYTNIAGNVTDSYEKTEWEDILRSSLLDALQPALSQIAAKRIEYYELPGHTVEIRNALTEVLRPDWTETRGIELVKLTINSLSIPEDQRKKITEWEENAMSTNAAIANARLVGAQADAARIAAGNEAGAAVGFMGMGMAMNAGGGSQAAQNLFTMQQQQMQMQQQQAQAAPAPAQNGWKCACGAVANGKFCPECDSPKPVEEGWTCSCGAVNKGKFCPECGAMKPTGVPQYKCDKCGWEPEKGVKPPRFCPECGDPFDNGDLLN